MKRLSGRNALMSRAGGTPSQLEFAEPMTKDSGSLKLGQIRINELLGYEEEREICCDDRSGCDIRLVGVLAVLASDEMLWVGSACVRRPNYV